MIRRLYVHNYRCLKNFELPVAGQSSALLIGKNGAGKTTVGFALEVLQKIARGTNRVADLVKPKDFAHGRREGPMRFEIEVQLSGQQYFYEVAFDDPPGFKELRVIEEKLNAGSELIFSRKLNQVTLVRNRQKQEARFGIDWHLVALPIIPTAAGRRSRSSLQAMACPDGSSPAHPQPDSR